MTFRRSLFWLAAVLLLGRGLGSFFAPKATSQSPGSPTAQSAPVLLPASVLQSPVGQIQVDKFRTNDRHMQWSVEIQPDMSGLETMRRASRPIQKIPEHEIPKPAPMPPEPPPLQASVLDVPQMALPKVDVPKVDVPRVEITLPEPGQPAANQAMFELKSPPPALGVSTSSLPPELPKVPRVEDLKPLVIGEPANVTPMSLPREVQAPIPPVAPPTIPASPPMAPSVPAAPMLVDPKPEPDASTLNTPMATPPVPLPEPTPAPQPANVLPEPKEILVPTESLPEIPLPPPTPEPSLPTPVEPMPAPVPTPMVPVQTIPVQPDPMQPMQTQPVPTQPFEAVPPPMGEPDIRPVLPTTLTPAGTLGSMHISTLKSASNGTDWVVEIDPGSAQIEEKFTTSKRLPSSFVPMEDTGRLNSVTVTQTPPTTAATDPVRIATETIIDVADPKKSTVPRKVVSGFEKGGKKTYSMPTPSQVASSTKTAPAPIRIVPPKTPGYTPPAQPSPVVQAANPAKEPKITDVEPRRFPELPEPPSVTNNSFDNRNTGDIQQVAGTSASGSCSTCGRRHGLGSPVGGHYGQHGHGCAGCSGCCGAGGCVPGQRPCAPFEPKSYLGECFRDFYHCMCCPDPCYDPQWLPLANAAIFADGTRPVTQTTIRWDAGVNGRFPDRSEYIWARADGNGKGPKPPAGVLAESRFKYNDLVFVTETAKDKISAIVQMPYRSLDPDLYPHASGFSDMAVGTKTLLHDCEMMQVGFRFLTYIPLGKFSNGLGTGHISLEPALLMTIKLGPVTYCQFELAEWIPLGGDPVYAGAVMRSHTSFNHLLYSITPDVPIVGTFEVQTWSFQDGAYTSPVNGPFQQSSGDTYVSVGPGLRIFICDKVDFGFGVAFSVGEDHFAQTMYRTAFRVRF